MRILVCRDCGKRYDYDKDDFCPKCGSYNPPQDDPSTPLERELLARFAPARESQATAKTSSKCGIPPPAPEPHRHMEARIPVSAPLPGVYPLLQLQPQNPGNTACAPGTTRSAAPKHPPAAASAATSIRPSKCWLSLSLSWLCWPS